MKMKVLAASGLLAVASTAGAQVEPNAGGSVAAENADVAPTRAQPAVAEPAATQPAPESGAAPAAESEDLGIDEIIVTARRKNESLQDVPQSVSAVSAETIEKLNILKFEEVGPAVAGLNLGSGLAAGGSAGSGTSTTMRGVSFSPASQTSPTVEFYLNDAPIESNFLFQSMFDVGQVEVLRGPQGTLRGRSAPSGAITMTSKRPDLSETGGYFSLTRTSLDAINAQGAVNLPLIKDVLALRIAGVDDRNESDGVSSLNSDVDPVSKTGAARISLRFQPTDTVSADLMYQYMDRDTQNFQQVVGSGSPGTRPGTTAGYNGPVIKGSDFRGVSDGMFDTRQEFNVVNGNLEWSFSGQKLSYVGSYYDLVIDAVSPTDIGNLIPGREFDLSRFTDQSQMTHELRLASEDRIAGFLDYVVGAFYSKSTSDTNFTQAASFLPGAFGSPVAAPNPLYFDQRYQLNSFGTFAQDKDESSLFGSVTLHLGEKTELAVGGRIIDYHTEAALAVPLGSALIAQAVPAGTPCAVVPGSVGQTYTNTCDFAVPARLVSYPPTETNDKPFIYNVSLSHRLTETLMVYANTGTAWRSGPSLAGINNGQNDADLDKSINLSPEESQSYEIGFKSSFLDNRARVNVALYHQKFDGLIFTTPPTPYVSCSSPDDRSCSVTAGQTFTTNANAVVDGIDVDLDFRLTKRWTAASAFSYSDGHVDDDQIPCTPPNYDGTRASFPDGNVYLCNSSRSVSQSTKWNVNLRSEYWMPITSTMDGYVRGLYTYYPENENRSQNFVASEYGLLNLYAGVRSPEGNWELAAFAKNALDTEKQLSLDPLLVAGNGSAAGYFGSSGYQATSYTPHREFGITLRYSFGSF